MNHTYVKPNIKTRGMDTELPLALSTENKVSPNPSFAKETDAWKVTDFKDPVKSVWDE